MLKNYLKSAWRNLTRNKTYSAINIVGLAIGLAVCMMIMLYTGHESSYDRFHKNAQRIYWIQGKLKMGNDSVFVPLMSYATAPMIKKNEPFVESFVRLRKGNKSTIVQSQQSPELKFAENNFLFADSNFFDFFSFKLLAGSQQNVLQRPFTVVISKRAAQKYFGHESPVGKVIRCNNAYTFTVTGVAENVPSNSSINYDFVASITSLSSITAEKQATQSQRVQLGSFTTYFLLNTPESAPLLEASLLKLNKSTNEGGEANERYIATPLTSTHLEANYADASNIKYLRVFPFVATLILLLALTNYMSLSSARATIRAKEIGVRKVMGAGRKAIAMQFFIESAIYTVIAFAFGYCLCATFQPLFFRFLQIGIDDSFLYQPAVILSFAVLLIITVLIAATYPSIVLSAYKPVLVLYGKFSKHSGGLGVRKFFTIFQFTISVILILCSIIINNQLYFFKHADTGVNHSNIVMLPFTPSIGSHYVAYKKEVKSIASIEGIATASYPMYKGYDMFFTKAKKSQENVSLSVLSVDESFIPLLGLQWKTTPTESHFNLKNNVILINETAREKLNLGNNPINERIAIGNEHYQVAGVLKNFNYESLQQKIGALTLFITKDAASDWGTRGGCLFIKIKPHTNIPSVIYQLKSIYKKYDSQSPFVYYFTDDAFEAMYKAENRLSKLFIVFTAFTILIACLGLFGLATFSAQQRVKEMGIRKVLGASVTNLVLLLSKDFLNLIIISILIASPIAYYYMHKWLEGFAYRIGISWWIFIIAGLVALLIALMTISYQAIKTANANPVKSLRTE